MPSAGVTGGRKKNLKGKRRTEMEMAETGALSPVPTR